MTGVDEQVQAHAAERQAKQDQGDHFRGPVPVLRFAIQVICDPGLPANNT
ncbi:MAG: hypothetical protein JWP45_631 [Mucilaginibacter sp.]|nr:hypothetical protein [Mucilaginibacter sp.]